MGSLRMHVQPVLGEPTLMLAFEGWNDACESASTAIRFVDAHLRGVPLAEIDPDDYFDFTVRRPHVQYSSGQSGEITWPSNEFRYGVTEDGLELITGLGIEPHMRWRSYCESIVELFHHIRIHLRKLKHIVKFKGIAGQLSKALSALPPEMHAYKQTHTQSPTYSLRMNTHARDRNEDPCVCDMT